MGGERRRHPGVNIGASHRAGRRGLAVAPAIVQSMSPDGVRLRDLTYDLWGGGALKTWRLGRHGAAVEVNAGSA